MSAKVRCDDRRKLLFLDIYYRGHRHKIYSQLSDTTKNRQVLKAKAEQIDREIFLGTFDPVKHFPERERHQPLSFRVVAEEWLRKKANEVAPLTLRWYLETVEGRILPFWGSKLLEKLKPVMFDDFKAGLLQDKLAPRTVNVILMRLREILRMAHDRGHTKENLARWVVLVKNDRSNVAPFSFEEKAAFLEVLSLRWRPYFVVAFGTGLRPSEQIALKWEALDWEQGKILVREGWRHGQNTKLKTAAAFREVDILPAVKRALEEQRMIAGGSELVFPSRRGKHLNLGNLRRRVWYPALAKAGLKDRDLYNTRHSFATHALASGEDPGWVAKMLGHTTLTMLMTRYYRYIPNLTRHDGKLLAERLERGGEAKPDA